MKGDLVQQEGSWALVTLNLDSSLLCILPGQLNRPGKSLVVIERDFKQNKTKTLSKACVCISFSCQQKSVLLCDYFKENWSCRGQLLTHAWLLNFSLPCIIQTHCRRIQKKLACNTFLMDFLVGRCFPIGRIP